jgi:hypothetical protein
MTSPASPILRINRHEATFRESLSSVDRRRIEGKVNSESGLGM